MRPIKSFALAGAAAAVTALGIAWSGSHAQTTATPTARYTLDAGTTVGPMAAMTGGPTRELVLKLGSSLSPTGGPARADHFMPAAAQLGASVPLATPERTRAGAPTPTIGDGGLPRGRMKIFWGCGAHAGPGQPVVIDFATVRPGQPSPLGAVTLPSDPSPSAGNSRTYGDWPNDRGRRQQVSARSSLLGEHRVAGNYSPEIRFALAQDFMPALSARAGTAADGSLPLTWNAVTGATGYYAYAVGSNGGDTVIWSSSATKVLGGMLNDWLSPTTVARLVAQKTVLPASQTSCTVPAEVKAAGGAQMVNLTAFGPEQDFAYPPRPAGRTAAWKPEWTVRARFRSQATVMPGMAAMAAGMSGGTATQARPGDTPEMAAARANIARSRGAGAGAAASGCRPNAGSIASGLLGGGRPRLGGLLGAAAAAGANAAACRQ
jgi:hypothetical protein